MNETLQTLKNRRSVRAYRPEQVREEELAAILEAGTYAPSAMGRQSAVMVVVQDAQTMETLRKMNAAVMGDPDADPFYGAPTVVVVLADPNACGDNWRQDGSLVMGNLMNAAASLGVASCWINRATEMFDSAQGKELLKQWGLSEELRGVGHCILGYARGEIPAAKPRKEGYILRP